MKPLFRCEYCSQIGTKEELEKHEKICLSNPAVKCCDNCKFAWEKDWVCLMFKNNNGEILECKYREYMINQESSSSISTIRDPIPESRICEHYERGTPGKIIPV